MRREPRRPVAPEHAAPDVSTPPIWSPPSEAAPDRDEGTGLRRRAGNPWPSTAAFGPNGLEIGGVAAEELAARYGTPLLVVDEEDLRARCRALRSQFPRVLYAVKAFTSHAVIRIAVKEGIDLLVATEGELDACLRAGVAGHHVVLHGNNKSDRELELAVSAGCGFVIVDNAEELERLDRIARARGLVQPVLIRIIPEVEAGTHPAVETGAVGSKFGTPLARAPDVVRLADSLPGVRYEGLHAHIGSQVLRPEPYVEAVDTLLDLLAELERTAGVRTGVIDIGGGFGVTYTKEEPLALSALASRVLGRVLVASEQRALSPPSLIVEPGRSLIANAVVTLYRVGSIKREGEQGPLLAVDGGMSDNIRPMLYGARFTVASASAPLKDPSTRFTIVGKHCESGDVLAQDAELPADIAPGGLVAFAATGAYTYSMASNYNRIGRPAVAAVRLGGSELWLRREDATDMDRLETAVVHSDPHIRIPQDVAVRPAKPRDAASFLEMWREVVGEQRYVRSEDAHRPARFYRRRFKQSWGDDQAQLVAVADRRVVGHVSVQREGHPVARHVATLGIAVSPDRRGGGVGSALLAEALRWARSVGVEKVVLSVYPDNTAAVALYRKFGFVEEGRLARQSRKSYGYEDEILMARWLGRETR
jgi:diaminopimelate decarboxylase